MLLSQRPLTASVADMRLMEPPGSSIALDVQARLRRGMNCLVTGEPGSGRTSMLNQVAYNLRYGGLHTLEVDAEHVTGAPALLAAVLRSYARTPRAAGELPDVEQAFVEGQRAVADGLRDASVHGPTPEVEDLIDLFSAKGPGGSCVLIDNLSGQVGHDLFGRHRDAVWQLPLVWAAAVADDEVSTATAPPADVFWERRLRLDRLTAEEAEVIARRRLVDVSAADGDRAIVEGALPRILGALDRPTPRQLLAAMSAALVGGSGDATAPGDAGRIAVADQAGGRRGAMLLYEVEVAGHPVHAGDAGLLNRLGISRARASQLLNALEDAGLLRSFDQGRRKLYEPVPLP